MNREERGLESSEWFTTVIQTTGDTLTETDHRQVLKHFNVELGPKTSQQAAHHSKHPMEFGHSTNGRKACKAPIQLYMQCGFLSPLTKPNVVDEILERPGQLRDVINHYMSATFSLAAQQR